MANPRSDDIIKLAQGYVRDVDGDKYPSDTYVTHLNTAIAALYALHPCAFYVSTVITAAPATIALGDDVPVLPKYAEALAHYVAAQLLLEGADDEYNRKLQADHLNLFVQLSA